jgi:hypothetical protein
MNNTAGSNFDPNDDIEGSDFQQVFVGGSEGSGVPYTANCQIAELIMYDAALDDADRTAVYNYLALKYDL